ncbi:sporulation membrane protein YtaF [Clostridium neuense]|uniref:Sporulation membrane protein YtaF n=1 Tax=Clostridium neuense TaxID=1728934 RepID=A0ABW8TKQ6_9CLOT
MQILSTILFVLSASTDNFVVGLCYGIKKIKINLLINLLIAIISAVGTALSMELGSFIGIFVPTGFTNILGSGILILIGLWAIIGEFRQNKKSSKSTEKNSLSNIEDILSNPENADKDTSGSIDLKESFSLSIALALNNMGLGIGASISGLNIILTTILTFFISIVTISLGLTIGNKYLSDKLGKYAAVISGLIIILLGIYEMLAK